MYICSCLVLLVGSIYFSTFYNIITSFELEWIICLLDVKRKLVGEEAFVRITPAVSGVADRSTAHNLFKALAGDEGGISLSLWCTYVNELLK